MGNNDWKRQFCQTLGFNHWRAGNYGEAMKYTEKLWASAVEDQAADYKRNALFLKALFHLEKEQIDQALTMAEKLKEINEELTNPKLIRDYYVLQGMIELKKKDYSKAIDHMERGYALYPEQNNWFPYHAFVAYDLGLAYVLSENFDKAEQAFDNIINMTTGRLWWGDLYAKSFYMLGKICEQQGDTAKAKEHYEKFLDLWKDADPGIQEVEDARKRMNGLKTRNELP